LDQSLVEAPELLNEQNALQYRATVGVLMYLMICTRPDLAYRSFVLCPALSMPLLLNACFGILPARKTSESPLSNPYLYGYSDSDFAADLNNRRSTSGFIFLLNGGPISWKSKQQSLVTTSTLNAKYVGLANASYEVIWLRKIILSILPGYTEHTEHTMPANNLYCGNQGAIATASQPIHAISNRSKHVDVRFHVICDAAANGLIHLEYVRISHMTADILTKALPKELHQRHVKGLGMDRAPKGL
jgi:hypothetical protein